jgi:hypothetical protein
MSTDLFEGLTLLEENVSSALHFSSFSAPSYYLSYYLY